MQTMVSILTDSAGTDINIYKNGNRKAFRIRSRNASLILFYTLIKTWRM